MRNLALFISRIIAGSLVAGHGAQKLFGWFEGPGIQKWSEITDSSLGLKPGKFWGPMGAFGEFGGGVLTAVGLLNPLGPIMMGSMMLAAGYKGHWGKPIWTAKGGAELSLSFLATALLVGADGPGAYSLDSALGIRVPRWMTAIALLSSAGMLAETVRPTLTPRVLAAANASGYGQEGA